jgi:hypothetical protein
MQLAAGFVKGVTRDEQITFFVAGQKVTKTESRNLPETKENNGVRIQDTREHVFGLYLMRMVT